MVLPTMLLQAVQPSLRDKSCRRKVQHLTALFKFDNESRRAIVCSTRRGDFAACVLAALAQLGEDSNARRRHKGTRGGAAAPAPVAPATAADGHRLLMQQLQLGGIDRLVPNRSLEPPRWRW